MAAGIQGASIVQAAQKIGTMVGGKRKTRKSRKYHSST
jgi:hypothetical protein